MRGFCILQRSGERTARGSRACGVGELGGGLRTRGRLDLGATTIKGGAACGMRSASAMPIGKLTLELTIPHAQSLKDRRQVVRSLKDKLRHAFNLSIAELNEGGTIWNQATLQIAVVSSSTQSLTQHLESIDRAAHRISLGLSAEISGLVRGDPAGARRGGAGIKQKRKELCLNLEQERTIATASRSLFPKRLARCLKGSFRTPGSFPPW